MSNDIFFNIICDTRASSLGDITIKIAPLIRKSFIYVVFIYIILFFQNQALGGWKNKRKIKCFIVNAMKEPLKSV